MNLRISVPEDQWKNSEEQKSSEDFKKQDEIHKARGKLDPIKIIYLDFQTAYGSFLTYVTGHSPLPFQPRPENFFLSSPFTVLSPFLLFLKPYLLPLILSFPLPHVSSESSMPHCHTFLNWLVGHNME